MKLLLVLAVVCLTALGAQAQKKCCTYDKFEGLLFQKQGSYDEPKNIADLIDLEGRISLDYKIQKIYMNFKMKDFGKGSDYEVLVLNDFPNKIEYVVVNNKNCQKLPLTTNMHTQCIPDDAEFLGSRNYAGVQADTWRFASKSMPNMDTRLTVSNEKCVPIQEVSAGFGDVSRMFSTKFLNVTEGIKDPKVFDIPEACKKATHIPLDTHLMSRLHRAVFRQN